MKYLFVLLSCISCILTACHPKAAPAASPVTSTSKNVKAGIIKTPPPKWITVNEAAAKKDVNGRRYYDLEGRRYWRNKKDGKYYLYFKGIFNHPQFN